MSSNLSTLRELLDKSFSRYINVLPLGFKLPHNKIVPSLTAELLNFSPARTLYQNRQPSCRSLDGIRSLKQNRDCASCLSRKSCTPQIYLELFSNGLPLSLILAYTSARNFLQFVSAVKSTGQSIENAVVLLTVRDRGRWGEVCFELKSPGQEL